VLAEHVGPLEHVAQGQQQFLQVQVGGLAFDVPVRHLHLDREHVAPQLGQPVQILGRLLETLVFLQPPDQFGTRILAFLLLFLGTRQQHARLDLRQHGRHHQILGRQFQAQLAHHLDIFHVLGGDLRQRNVENVEVLPLDEVEQQVQRPLEGVEKDLQRIGRDVEILG